MRPVKLMHSPFRRLVEPSQLKLMPCAPTPACIKPNGVNARGLAPEALDVMSAKFENWDCVSMISSPEVTLAPLESLSTNTIQPVIQPFVPLSVAQDAPSVLLHILTVRPLLIASDLAS